MKYKLFLWLVISVKSIFCPCRLEELSAEEIVQLRIYRDKRIAQFIKNLRKRRQPKIPMTIKREAEEKRVHEARLAQNNKIISREEQAALVARLSCPKKIDSKNA
jgi:hypothetical protein